jgi:hypothetical protein
MNWFENNIFRVGVAYLLWLPTWYGWAFEPDWGMGLVTPCDVAAISAMCEPLEGQESGVQFPAVPIPIFSTPGEASHGRLVKSPGSRWSLMLERDSLMGPHAVEISHEFGGNGEFVPCAYAEDCLKVYQFGDGFVNILRTVGGSGVWMRVTDLQQAGYLPIDYVQWLIDEQQHLHALWLPERGITVRERPGFSQRKLVTIPAEKGFDFSLEFTGDVQETWAEAEVCYYTNRCEIPTENPLYADGHCFLGWLKILDRQGFPNVWYNTEGC